MIKNTIKKIGYLLFAIAMVVILFLLSIKLERAKNPMNRLEQLSFQGTYHYTMDAEKNEINENMKWNPNHQRMIIFEGHFNRTLEAREQIMFRLHYLSLEIYQNGSLIYAYGTDEKRPFFTESGGNTWMYFYTEGIAQTDDIRIILRNSYGYNQKNVYQMFLKNIYTGDKMSLLREINKRTVLLHLLCLIITLIGFLMLVVSISFYLSGIEIPRSTHWCSGVIIFAGLWGFMLDASITLIYPFGISLSMLSNVFLSLTATLKIRYDSFFLTGNRRKMVKILFQISLLVNIISCMLQAFSIYSIIETLTFIIPVSLGVTIIVTVFLFVESASKPSFLSKIYLASAVEFVTFCSVGSFLYLVLHRDGSVWLLLGFFFFALFQFVILAVRVGYVFRDSRRANEMETKILQKNIAITLSQIRPHFLFNVLTAIQQLCEMNPEKAKQAIENFSFYLRGNLDSLEGRGLISFQKEIGHVKYYLELEQLRFSERLHVIYDLQVEDFFLPALTVQPIVENAVKYGVTKRKEGGTVSILTRLQGDEVVIQVQDDGTGFDVEKYMEEHSSHIGIENVSNRLKSLCNGTLEIQSEIGVGTIVTMRIPSQMYKK